MRKIYVATSWRNLYQPAVVEALRLDGHEVYDFRHPKPNDTGFSWNQITNAQHASGRVAGSWQNWTPEEYRAALQHPLAEVGFKSDMDALHWCDLCVLVMPCGRSAYLEAGWAAGAGKHVIMFVPEPMEPELMVKMFDWGIALTLLELLIKVENEP